MRSACRKPGSLLLIAAAVATASLAAHSQEMPAAAERPAETAPADDVAALIAEGHALFDAKRPNFRGARDKANAALRIAPDSIDARVLYGLAQNRLKNHRLAAQTLAVVRRRDPGRVGIARALAESYEAVGNGRGAAAEFLRAAREDKTPALGLKAARLAVQADDPNTAFEGFHLARSLVQGDEKVLYARLAEQTGNPRTAKGLHEALAQEAPDPTPHHIAIARLSLALGEEDAARSMLEQILAAQPGNADALLGLADIARKRGDAELEQKWIADACAAHPTHPDAHRRMGELLLERKQLDGARAAFERQLGVNEKDFASHTGLSKVALAAGDGKSAVQSARNALAASDTPRDPALNLLLGRALRLDQRHDEALEPLRLGTHRSSDAEALLDLADSQVKAGSDRRQLAQARDVARRIAEKDSANTRAQEVFGFAALKLGEKGIARVAFGRAVAGRQDDPDVFVRVAGAYESIGDVQDAEALLDRALELKSDHANAARARAHLFVRAGEFDRALPLLETAARAHPEDVEVLVALGAAHRAGALRQAGGGAELADTPVRRALELQPSHPGANELAGLLELDRARRAPDAAAREAARAKAQPFLIKALEGRPGHESLAFLAARRRDSKDTKGARELLARVREEPRPGDVLAVEAALDFDAADYTSAENKIARYLATNPDDPEAFAVGGDIAAERRQPKEARSRYETALRKGTLAAEQQGRFAGALAAEGAFPLARDMARSAIARGLDTGSAHATLGWALFRLGDTEGAKTAVTRALEKGAKDARTRFILGEIAWGEGKEDDALSHYKAALKIDPKSAEASGAAGRILLGRRQFPEALPLLRTAHAGLPEEPIVAAALAECLLALGNRTTEAEEIVNALPDDALDPATLYGLRGDIAHQRGNFVKASKDFDRALAASPGNADILQKQARNFLKMPQYEKAIAALEQAQKQGARADVAQTLARLYAETGQREKASEANAQAEEILSGVREEARKRIPENQIRRVALAEFFSDKSPEGQEGQDYRDLGRLLPDGIARDLSKSPYIQLVVRDEKTLAELEKQKEQWALEHEDPTPEDLREFEKLFGKGVEIAPFVLDGHFAVLRLGSGPEQLQLTARIVEVKGQKMVRSATRSGPIEDFARIQNAVALELLGEFVPLSQAEREQIANALPTGNLESMRLIAAADEARSRGDLRQATSLLKRARQADEGNLAAIERFQRTQKELGVRNRIAVRDFSRVRDAPTWIETSIQSEITSKLSNIEGIQVVERDDMPAVVRELELWAVEQADVLEFGTDEEKERVAQEAESRTRSLPVGAVVGGSYALEHGTVVIHANLVDVQTRVTLLSEQVSGSETEVFRLLNTLAEKIARRLVGAPSEEEIARLREKREFEQFKRDMEELALRREAERLQKEEVAVKALVAQSGARQEAALPLPVKTPTKPAPKPPPPPSSRPGVWMKARWMASADSHPLGMDLSLSHFHKASRSGAVNVRSSYVVGFASNRWSSTRAYDYAPLAIYDTGLDWDIDFRWRRVSFGFGAAFTLGMTQSLTEGTSGETTNHLLLSARPRVGLAYELFGLRWSGDVGYQFARTGISGDGPSLSGVFLQGGVSWVHDTMPRLPSGFELGYGMHLISPNGARMHQKYGGAFGKSANGGRLLEHTLLLGSGGSHARHALLLGWMGSKANTNEGELSFYEVGWDYEYRFHPDRRAFNPFLGWKLTVGRISAAGLGKCESACSAFVAAPRLGVSSKVLGPLEVRASLGYDAIFSSLSDDSDPSGLAVDAGASLRF